MPFAADSTAWTTWRCGCVGREATLAADDVTVVTVVVTVVGSSAASTTGFTTSRPRW